MVDLSKKALRPKSNSDGGNSAKANYPHISAKIGFCLFREPLKIQSRERHKYGKKLKSPLEPFSDYFTGTLIVFGITKRMQLSPHIVNKKIEKIIIN